MRYIGGSVKTTKLLDIFSKQSHGLSSLNGGDRPYSDNQAFYFLRLHHSSARAERSPAEPQRDKLLSAHADTIRINELSATAATKFPLRDATLLPTGRSTRRGSSANFPGDL
jgi:hypothetical protein